MGPWKTATALDRQRNEPLGFHFDEYPVARVIQDWLSLDEKPDPKLERELVVALLEERKNEANKETILATIAFDEDLAG